MMIPKPIKLTKIVRKMMKSGRVTDSTLYNLRIMTIDGARLRRRSTLPCLAVTAFVFWSMTAGDAAPGRAQEPTRVASPRTATMRPEIVGTHGIVAGGRHYSVAAGIRILEQGGNAIDAGVATVLAASVVEISHFGFGGEAPVMIFDAKTHGVTVVNGQ